MRVIEQVKHVPYIFFSLPNIKKENSAEKIQNMTWRRFARANIYIYINVCNARFVIFLFDFRHKEVAKAKKKTAYKFFALYILFAFDEMWTSGVEFADD